MMATARRFIASERNNRRRKNEQESELDCVGFCDRVDYRTSAVSWLDIRDSPFRPEVLVKNMSYCPDCGKEYESNKYYLKRCPTCQELWRIETSYEDLQQERYNKDEVEEDG